MINCPILLEAAHTDFLVAKYLGRGEIGGRNEIFHHYFNILIYILAFPVSNGIIKRRAY